jgi:sulfur carrier protein
MSEIISISLNGETTQVAPQTLASLLETLGYEAASVATAVNQNFVAKTQREQLQLSDGMKVDVVSPMQGG